MATIVFKEGKKVLSKIENVTVVSKTSRPIFDNKDRYLYTKITLECSVEEDVLRLDSDE